MMSMSRRRVTLAVFSFLVATGTTACSKSHEAAQETASAPAPAEHAHWDYSEHGPASWGALSPEFVACAEGSRQSPVDLSPKTLAARNGAPLSLHVDHVEQATSAVDNGHTIQVDCAGGDSITVGTESFRLAQYHFHAPSEHTVEGKPYPMEMHLVHRSESGRLAVLGLLIEEGAANAALDAVWSRLPAHEGEEIAFKDLALDLDQLLPKDRSAWSYEGSLTTPPCSEGVRWLVLEKPITMSKEQIERFRAIVHDNNRPTQPLNERPVVVEKLSTASNSSP